MDQFESRISHLRRVGVFKRAFFDVGLSLLAKRVVWSLKSLGVSSAWRLADWVPQKLKPKT